MLNRNHWLPAICLALLFVTTADAQQKSKKKPKARPKNNAFAKITDDAKLPRVLLIGDSISIGYTVATRSALAGKANVHRIPTNGGPTTKGLQSIDAWLGDSKWDVIHFNWGLHDLKYLGSNGKNLADPKAAGSRQQVPIDEYEANLRKLVARLKKTDATLIWRSTTPVPEGANGRVVGDSAKYNAVAKAIMDEHDIAIDDQYSFALGKLKKIQLPANVHFSKDGSKELAKQAVTSIQEALAR